MRNERISQFHAPGPFLYFLKTSENQMFFYVFSGVERKLWQEMDEKKQKQLFTVVIQNMRCLRDWYHFYDFKNVKNTKVGVLLLEKLQG